MKRFIIQIIGVILFVALMLLIAIKTDKFLHPIKIEPKLIYDWYELPDYANKAEDDVVKMIGYPNKTRLIEITGYKTLGPHEPLFTFLSSHNDTIYFKELLWKQDNYNFYIWFKEKDSVWISVQGVKYDPNLVQF